MDNVMVQTFNGSSYVSMDELGKVLAARGKVISDLKKEVKEGEARLIKVLELMKDCIAEVGKKKIDDILSQMKPKKPAVKKIDDIWTRV